MSWPALAVGLAVLLVGGEPLSWQLAEPGRRLAELAVDPERGAIAVRVTSPDEPDCLAVVSQHRPGPRHSAGQALGRPVWLPGGSLAAPAGDGLWIWSGGATTHWPLALLPGPAAVSADGSRMAVALPAGGTGLLDPRTGIVASRLATAGALIAVALRDDGGQAVTVEEANGAVRASRLTRWRTDTGAQLAARELPPTSALAVAGALVVTGDAAGVRLWNAALEPLGRAEIGPVVATAVSSDRRFLAVASGNRVCWFGLPSLEPLAVIRLPGEVSDVAFVGGELAVATGETLRLQPAVPAGPGSG